MAKGKRSKILAISILASVGLLTFGASTLAVSLAGTTSAPAAVPAGSIPFSSLVVSGGVQPGSQGVYTLQFVAFFTLSSESPGITTQGAPTPAGGPGPTTLDNLTIEQDVAYPVPAVGAASVGPVGLPFADDTLSLVVNLTGGCFTVPGSGGSPFVLTQGTSCVTATLGLNGGAPYNVSGLLQGVTARVFKFGQAWAATVQAQFDDPGFTFPVVTLGSGGGTTFTIGQNSGEVTTGGVQFYGANLSTPTPVAGS